MASCVLCLRRPTKTIGCCGRKFVLSQNIHKMVFWDPADIFCQGGIVTLLQHEKEAGKVRVTNIRTLKVRPDFVLHVDVTQIKFTFQWKQSGFSLNFWRGGGGFIFKDRHWSCPCPCLALAHIALVVRGMQFEKHCSVGPNVRTCSTRWLKMFSFSGTRFLWCVSFMVYLSVLLLSPLSLRLLLYPSMCSSCYWLTSVVIDDYSCRVFNLFLAFIPRWLRHRLYKMLKALSILIWLITQQDFIALYRVLIDLCFLFAYLYVCFSY
jgi:hypothetical protein